MEGVLSHFTDEEMRLGDLVKTTQPWRDPWPDPDHAPDLSNIFNHGSLSFVTPGCYPESWLLFIYSSILSSTICAKQWAQSRGWDCMSDLASDLGLERLGRPTWTSVWVVTSKCRCQFLRTAIMKSHKCGDLKHQKVIILQFWRLEVHSQDAGRAMLPLKLACSSF